MEELLNLDFIQLKPEYIKVIIFIWKLIKCTILLVITVKLLRWFLNKLFKQISKTIDSTERVAQLLTLKTIVSHAIEAIIFTVFAMNMLYIIGIDVRPILATAGVAGVAIGFGAKRLVEDIITGIIILIEGQIRVGDYVEIQGMSGIVEKITLPLITVRSGETGALNFIRCGHINTITNHTMNYAYAFFPVEVAYKENINHVFDTLKKAYRMLYETPEYKELIEGELEIFGLDEFKESSLLIKCRIKTKPKGQWTIKRAFNKIIKEQFEVENIEIPFNQLVVTGVN